jgi:hypothetical protein
MRALLIGLLLAAMVAGLAAAGPAQAQQGTVVARPRFLPAAGPVLAGDNRLAWVSRRDDRVLDLWVLEIGGAPRRIQRFSGSDDERLRSVRLIASPTEIGLELSVAEASRTSSRSYSGPFGQPLVPVAAVQVAGADAATSAGRAVWVTRGCASTEIRTVALPAPALIGQREPRCRLRLRRAVALRGDRLRLGISCAGFAIDCSARVSVRARGRVIARGDARYTHSTPPFAAADLRLTPSGVRLLRRHPQARLRISARIGSSAPVRWTTRTIARR